MPQRLGAHFAVGRHVVGDLHELVALERDRVGFVVARQGHVQLGVGPLLSGPPRLPLASVQQLEDARDVLGVRSDHVPLGHRPNVEHFATKQKDKPCVTILLAYSRQGTLLRA